MQKVKNRLKQGLCVCVGNRTDGLNKSQITRQSALVLMKPARLFYSTDRIVGTSFAWKSGVGTVESVSFEQ